MKEKIKNLKEKLTIKNILITVITILIILGAIGATYAWFSATVTGNIDEDDIIVTTAELRIVYTNSNELKAENILPGWSESKTFTVTNTGTGTAYYSVNWDNLTNTFTNKEDIVYTLTSTNGGGTLEEVRLPDTGTDINIIPQVKIEEGVTHTYTLTVTYKNREENQNEDQNKSLIGKIEILDINAPNEPTFADILKENNPPTTYTTVPGQAVSTTDEGLITGPTDDYGGTTYYFRGNVQDNYVSFAGKTWRVVRINGDNTVKMILDGTAPVDAQWNSTYEASTITAAINLLNYRNSPINTAARKWYNTNITGTNADKVATSKYCVDRSYTTSGSYNYFGAYNRLDDTSTAAPNMTCPQSSDIYNLNVGLLTADEVAFAGANWDDANSSYYLYVNDYWWTLSPYNRYSSGDVLAFLVYSDGHLGSSDLGYPTGVRPVISLESDVSVTGSGTRSNPYVVQ